jgi:hypothetical protein
MPPMRREPVMRRPVLRKIIEVIRPGIALLEQGFSGRIAIANWMARDVNE